MRLGNLPEDLIWYTRTPGLKPSKYRAPSFSWASIDGDVEYDYPGIGDSPDEIHTHITVQEVCVQTKPGGPYHSCLRLPNEPCANVKDEHPEHLSGAVFE